MAQRRCSTIRISYLEQQPFNLLKISFQLNLAREGEVEGSQTAFAEFCRQLGAESFEFIVNRKHA